MYGIGAARGILNASCKIMAEEQKGPPPAKRPKTDLREPNSSKYTSWGSSEVHSFFSLRGLKNIKDVFKRIRPRGELAIAIRNYILTAVNTV